MKRIVAMAFAAVLLGGAQAASSIATGSQGQFSLYAGADTGKELGAFETFDECRAAAARMPVGSYSCISKSTVVVTAIGAASNAATSTVTAPAIGTANTAAPRSMSNMPAIDTSKIPAPGMAFTTPRVKPVDPADPSQRPKPSDIGAFRTLCTFSHMSFDDPIVYPGRVGASHLHMFFGNSAANANSTPSSIAKTGGSTCAGGTLNRTAYWAPAMIDTSTGTPLTPNNIIIYYKTGYNGVAPPLVRPLPNGLRMITGNAAATAPGGPVHFACVGKGPDQSWHPSIPNCIAGDDMVMGVDFPQCWDGKNLDSPDHQSHMADANNSNPGCPATHPVPVPKISYEIHYLVTAKGTRAWRLSSDNYPASQPAGYSGHGDWFMGWDSATMATFIKHCDNASMDCHGYLLGDGTTLY